MGEEVSSYIGRLVPALQTAYGEAWNIEARGESPKIDDRAWQVCPSGTAPWVSK